MLQKWRWNDVLENSSIYLIKKGWMTTCNYDFLTVRIASMKARCSKLKVSFSQIAYPPPPFLFFSLSKHWICPLVNFNFIYHFCWKTNEAWHRKQNTVLSQELLSSLVLIFFNNLKLSINNLLKNFIFSNYFYISHPVSLFYD